MIKEIIAYLERREQRKREDVLKDKREREGKCPHCRSAESLCPCATCGTPMEYFDNGPRAVNRRMIAGLCVVCKGNKSECLT